MMIQKLRRMAERGFVPGINAVESSATLPQNFKSDACEAALSRFMCWMNFPRCDEFDESLPMCTSTCENLFRVCGSYSASHQWCGSMDVDVGWERRVHLNDNNTLITSNYFPGQPFKKNEFLPNSDVPKAVCTPSIKGASNKASSNSFVFLVFSSLSVFIWTNIL
jgi:hypothetical protein